MTNTAFLQSKMKLNGVTISSLAKAIGLSATGLHNKIHNKREFVASEIFAISKHLSLSLVEKEKIFFA